MDPERKSLYQRLAVEQAAELPGARRGCETFTHADRESVDEDAGLLMSLDPTPTVYGLEKMTKMQIQESIDDDSTMQTLVAG